jgi:DNA adenine methylase
MTRLSPGTREAEPFVRWAGGKRTVLADLDSVLPVEFGRYFESFLGGGALFFHRKPKIAFLSDMSEELIAAYFAIQNDPAGLLRELTAIYDRSDGTCDFYRQIRSESPEGMAAVARFLYLNATNFNGLYRKNKKGEDNVPPNAKRVKNWMPDDARIYRCSEALRGAIVTHGDYREIKPRAGDLVYFDPPYHSDDAGAFSTYGGTLFGVAEHIALAEFARDLRERGVHVVISNSSTGFVRELYSDWDCREVMVRRNINSNVDGRGPVGELIFYDSKTSA